MKLKIAKVCHGVIDTEKERTRIDLAFSNDPETRHYLLYLIDAIEEGQWEAAQLMLQGKWWTGDDEDVGCPRTDFIGELNVEDPEFPERPASGFSLSSGYEDLVYSMAEQVLATSRGAKDIKLTVQKIS
jgi:hypothetical protein